MGARRRKRGNPPRGSRAARPSFYPEWHENNVGRLYARKWHRVSAWVDDELSMAGYDEVGGDRTRGKARVWGGSYYSRAKDPTRVERRAVARVHDLTDAEEAYEKGIPLQYLGDFGEGPGRDAGGQRRVVITALTWSADDKHEVCYDPAWITLGHGMTARTAAAAASRWVTGYQDALAAHVESRRLILTALEIKFWTAPWGANYV